MKIWELKFEDGNGVWGKADLAGFELVKDIGEGGFRIAKEAVING